MSFEIPPADPASARPRNRGFGCFTLILLLVAGYVLLQVFSRRAPPNRQPPAERSGRAEAPVEPDGASIALPAPGTTVPGQVGDSSDWSIEEVDVKPPAEDDGGVTLTLPESPGAESAKEPPKRTTEGDWTVEELPAQPSNRN